MISNGAHAARHTVTRPYPYHFIVVTMKNRQLNDKPRCVSTLRILIQSEATQGCIHFMQPDTQRANATNGYKPLDVGYHTALYST